jgi:hypothetical protein
MHLKRHLGRLGDDAAAPAPAPDNSSWLAAIGVLLFLLPLMGVTWLGMSDSKKRRES